MAQNFASVDDYIATFTPDVQTVLQAILTRTCCGLRRDGVDQLSDPPFNIGGRPVVYLAGWMKHISLYPIPDLDENLELQIAPYLSGKGTVKFGLESRSHAT